MNLKLFKFVCLGLLMTYKVESKPVLVSEIVGQIQARPFTSRDVAINYALDTLLFHRGGNTTAIIPNKQSNQKYESAVFSTLMNQAIYEEAKDFLTTQVENEELNVVLAEFKKRLKTNKDYRKWKVLRVSDSELRERLKVKLRAKRLVQFKKKSAQIGVSDPDALIFYRKNSSQYAGKPFNSVRASIKAKLKSLRTRERMDQWYTVLQKKYKVKSLITQ